MEPPSPHGAADHGVRAPANKVGRPSGAADRAIVGDLMTAFVDLLETRSYLDISQRDIAARAGVSHAMIRYYFLSKDGLLQALVERLFDDLIADLRRLRRDLPQLSGSPTFHIVGCLARHIEGQSDVSRLALAEVNRAGSTLGDRIRARLVSRLLSQCHLIVGDQIATGRYRADLDRDQAVLAMTGLMTIRLIRLPMNGALQPVVRQEPSNWLSFCVQMLDSQFLIGSRPGD